MSSADALARATPRPRGGSRAAIGSASWCSSREPVPVADAPRRPGCRPCMPVTVAVSRWRRTPPSSSCHGAPHVAGMDPARATSPSAEAAVPTRCTRTGSSVRDAPRPAGAPTRAAGRPRRPSRPGPPGPPRWPGRPRPRPGAPARRCPRNDGCTPCARPARRPRSPRLRPDLTNRCPVCPGCPGPGCRPSPVGCWPRSRARRSPSRGGRSRTAASAAPGRPAGTPPAPPPRGTSPGTCPRSTGARTSARCRSIALSTEAIEVPRSRVSRRAAVLPA